MPKEAKVLLDQLRDTCKLTSASWAVVLEQAAEGWKSSISYGLDKTRRGKLDEFTAQPKVADWLTKSLSSGRVRSRATGEFEKTLGCQRVYVFANTHSVNVLLVGAEVLNSKNKSFIRILAKSMVGEDGLYYASLTDNPTATLSGRKEEFAYNPEDSFKGILATISRLI